MGSSNRKPEKTEEEIMKERWMKLGESKKTANEDEQPQKQENPPQREALVERERSENQSKPMDLLKNQESSTVAEVKKIPHIPNEKNDNTNTNTSSSSAMIVDATPPVITASEYPSRIIDKEHSTIEKIFRISLDKSEKFMHLSLYQAQLLSENREEVFKISDLDNIIVTIINDSEKRSIILEYLLETYHRSIEILEKRYKNEFDEQYSQIRKMIASYISLIIYSPDNFDLNLVPSQIIRELTKYYNDTEEFEIVFLLSDIISSSSGDVSLMSVILSYVFNIIHLDNTTSKNNFFNCEKIKKNLNIVTILLNDFPITREMYVSDAGFLPSGVNGRILQTGTLLGVYLSIASFEADQVTIKNSFPSMNYNESENITRVFSNKLNAYLAKVCSLFQLLIEDKSEMVSNKAMNFIYQIVNMNLEKMKMYSNPFSTSSLGFLMNSLYLCLKLFFDTCDKNGIGSSNIFGIIQEIDLMYCASSNTVLFSKFDRVNIDKAKEILESTSCDDNSDYNLLTKLFFICHAIMTYFIKNLDEEYTKTSQKLSEFFRGNRVNDPQCRETFSMLKSVDVYVRNPEYMKYILKFDELTCALIFLLNNNTYTIKDDYKLFLNDFYNHISLSSIECLSMLPTFVIKNLFHSSVFIRKFSAEALMADPVATRSLVYFGIIYSYQTELIYNPHLRSEVFDILLYFFVVNSGEHLANQVQAFFSKILNDDFVKNKLIFSLMRVFVDAERLGTSNQFYEKFTVRNKVLFLIEHIFKKHNHIFTSKIVEYASETDFDATRMVNYLMNDVTYLIDGCIEKLMEIKNFQDLQSNTEEFNKLDEETRQMELNKFRENDTRVKTELKLLNSSLGFMVIICQCLQDYFMKSRLSERLANLLNYCLDVFTSKANKLTIKNKSEYEFNPALILSSLIKIYVAFKNYKEFLEFIVLDERSYKYDNFTRVLFIKNEKEKLHLEYATSKEFDELVEVDLKKIEKEILSNKINFDDAPDEFLDPITASIMEDPVILPTSNTTVDRHTIETHLLSDPIDPFNRKPLSKESLIPHKELKEKIERYKKSKIEQK